MEPIVVIVIQNRNVSIRLASDELVVTETRYAVGERGRDLHVHHQHRARDEDELAAARVAFDQETAT